MVLEAVDRFPSEKNMEVARFLRSRMTSNVTYSPDMDVAKISIPGLCQVHATGFARSNSNVFMHSTMSSTSLIDSNLSDLELLSRGKVRDIYATSDPNLLLFVASDRISAYDVILRNVSLLMPYHNTLTADLTPRTVLSGRRNDRPYRIHITPTRVYRTKAKCSRKSRCSGSRSSST